MSITPRQLNIFETIFQRLLYKNSIKTGSKNKVCIGKSKLRQCHIKIKGENNTLTIGNKCSLRGMHILIIGDNNVIDIKNNVSINASNIQPTIINAAGGSKISIGENTLMSNNIEIHSSDYHGIYSLESGARINHEMDITIGNHVWIGLRCIILKGAVISDDSIVAAGSIVTKPFNVKNTILAGSPAKITKEGVTWDHDTKNQCPSLPLF